MTVLGMILELFTRSIPVPGRIPFAFTQVPTLRWFTLSVTLNIKNDVVYVSFTLASLIRLYSG